MAACTSYEALAFLRDPPFEPKSEHGERRGEPDHVQHHVDNHGFRGDPNPGHRRDRRRFTRAVGPDKADDSSGGDLGVEIAYVELGNEFYKDDSAYSTRFPTADDYINEAKVYSRSLRIRFPGVRIAVVGNARPRAHSRGNS